MNATETRALPDPAVIPDSLEQCHELLGRDGVLELHDFARDVGFESIVVATGTTLNRIVGNRVFERGSCEAKHALTDALCELQDAMRRNPGQHALVFTHRNRDGDAVETLVRNNFAANPPFTLLTPQ